MHIESQEYGMDACLCINSFVHSYIRALVDAALKHVCFILLLAKGMLSRPGMGRVWVQDVRNGAISIMADSGMPMCCYKKGTGGRFG